MSGGRDLGLLALCWASTVSSSCLITSIGPLCAKSLGASDSVATFSIALFITGCAAVSVPAIWLFESMGRVGGFLVGCAMCVIGGGLGLVGVITRSPALLFAACFCSGASQGLGQFYRFAAMEVCHESMKPVATTLVLSGGVIAAFAGPQLAIHSRTMLTHEYEGSFLVVLAVGVFNAALVLAVRFPAQKQQQPEPEGLGEKMIAAEEQASLWTLMTRRECVICSLRKGMRCTHAGKNLNSKEICKPYQFSSVVQY